MADPLSFVASVIAVTSLAGTVATKGYRYIKAVRDCPSEVRRLIAEVNVLCGVLDRLQILLQRDASQRSLEIDREDLDDEEDEAPETSIDSSGSGQAADNAAAFSPPDFIFECQKTLFEIEAILNKYSRTDVQSTGLQSKKSAFNISNLRRLEAKDLKWPLRRSKTLQLIENLERHKSTCALALAESSVAGVHSVLEQTRLSNRFLAEFKAKQEKMFELSLTREQEDSLAWLSSTDPALKLQTFRRERQRGTGTWLFDLPEMSHWLETSNSALWIYGIPGAGKTMLSTLVVDEVLTRKRSSSIGTAYFYIRHDDTASHTLSNVLGSLISQLARQNSVALTDIVNLRTQHSRVASSTMTLEDDELVEQLQLIAKHFSDTFIVIDGLDECGTAFDSDRKRLIAAVAALHCNNDCPIHMLIFSRDELDIREQLSTMGFQPVSIAATSADLRLYVNAWLPSLDIQSEELRTEVVDTLVNEANGMFMWVRAQVDYLQRLPNDHEKHTALKRLPPSLPETYSRIFETIDSMYPTQTTKYIQRLLKWIVHDANIGSIPLRLREEKLDLVIDELCEAGSLEIQNDPPLGTSTLTREQLLRWLGCLVRISKVYGCVIVNLSHFTVREFLTLDPEDVTSSVSRKYLVKPKEINTLLETCLTYIMHKHFRDQASSTKDEIDTMLSKFPFYKSMTTSLVSYIWASTYAGLSHENERLLRKFLSEPPDRSFELWSTCHALIVNYYLDDTLHLYFPSPMHFAAVTGLTKEVQVLLEIGVDSDGSSLLNREKFIWTPLHLAIAVGNPYGFKTSQPGNIHVTIRGDWDASSPLVDFCHEKSLLVIRALTDAGANVHKQLVVDVEDLADQDHDEIGTAIVTPFGLAIMCEYWQAASILLDMGVSLDAAADEDLKLRSDKDLCSIERLLVQFPHLGNSLQRFVDGKGNQALGKILEDWRLSCRIGESGNHAMNGSSNNLSPQEQFSQAYRDKSWDAVRDLLLTYSNIEVNQSDADGLNALYCVSKCEGEEGTLICLLEHGADPNLLTSVGYSVIARTAAVGFCDNIISLLRFGANIEHRDPGGWTPLLLAVDYRRHEALKLLLERGANINAVLDVGVGSLQIAIWRKDTQMFSLLLAHKADFTTADNYGATPLHEACFRGLEPEVEKLIELTRTNPAGYVNYQSQIYGTPLYVAAERGFNNIFGRLLDAGAEIDGTGPGNLLGSALMVACAKGHSETVKLLLSRGSSLEVEGSRFLSAAGTARAFRKERILKILEEHTSAIRGEEIVGDEYC